MAGTHPCLGLSPGCRTVGLSETYVGDMSGFVGPCRRHVGDNVGGTVGHCRALSDPGRQSACAGGVGLCRVCRTVGDTVGLSDCR